MVPLLQVSREKIHYTLSNHGIGKKKGEIWADGNYKKQQTPKTVHTFTDLIHKLTPNQDFSRFNEQFVLHVS